MNLRSYPSLGDHYTERSIDQGEIVKEPYHREWLVLLWLVVLVAVIRFPSLEEPFDNDGASVEYHAQLIMQGEPLYGTHHPGHHLPGLYYTYAIVFLLLGESSWAIKFVLISWTIVSSYLVYRLGVRLKGFAVGILAATFFALLASNVYLKGTTGATEMFAILPRIAAMWLCVELIERKAKGPAFALVGALGAIAFLYKAIYISPILVALALLAATARIEGPWGEFLRRASWMILGFALTLLPVIGYFASLGLLNRLLFVFRFGMGYIKVLDVPASVIAMILAPIVLFGVKNPLLLIAAIASLFVLARELLTSEWRFLFHRQHPINASSEAATLRDTAGLGLILWFGMSVFEAGIGHPGYPNYNLLLIPHLSLLTAWGLAHFYRRGAGTIKRRAAWLTTGYALIIVSMCIVANYSMYYHYYRYKRGMGTYVSFLQTTFSGRLFLEAKKLADYVEPRTSSSDYVYLWSDNMIFYTLAHRRAPIENQWPYYADVFGPYQRIFGPRTKYILVTGSALRPHPQWLYDELGKHYRLETVTGGHKIYRFTE